MNVLRITGLLIATVIAVVFLVKSTLGSALKKNIHSVYFKIFLNHLQMLLITASFNLDWPSRVQEFFSSTAPAAETSESIISFDCFLDDRRLEDVDQSANDAPFNHFRIFY